MERPDYFERVPGGFRRDDEGGFVLAAAAFSLLIVTVLVTGGFFMARQEHRVGVADSRAADAFYMAERGLAELMGRWEPANFSSLTPWTPVTVTDTVDGGEVAIRVNKLADRMFYIQSTATVLDGGLYAGATRSVGMMARLFSAQLEPPAALTTRGPTTIKGTAEVHGEDATPGTWSSSGVCSAFPMKDKPGVLTDDSTNVAVGGGVGNLTGVPALAQDTTISDETFTQFGELDWEDLIAMADKRLGDGGYINIASVEPVLQADSTCDRSAILNWGDPTSTTNPCSYYFPTVYIDGDITVQSGGVGQGVLLVDGTLDLRGNFVWYGIIIVQGTFETQGSGNRVFGGVLASNADFDAQSLVGGSVVENSTCASTRAILYNSSLTRVQPLAARSWVDISSVGS